MDIFSVIVIASLVVYLLIGVYAAWNLKGLDDFYVMSRNASPFLICGTLLATSTSSVALIGYTGGAYAIGPLPFVMVNSISLIGNLFVGLYLGRYLRRMKLWTLPDFFFARFPSETIRGASMVIVLVSMILYLIAVLLGVNVVLETIFGWGVVTSLVVTIGVITVFTFIGGMRGVVITDTVMFVVFFLAAVALAPFILSAAGGWPEGLQRASAELPRFTLWHGTYGIFEAIFLFFELGIVGIVLVTASPQMISRAYIARDEKSLARGMIYLALLLPIFGYCFVYIFGLMPLVAPDIESANAFPWAATNLAPALLGAIALAGIIAAVLSTASSLFQQAAATLSRDIYQRYVNPGVSESKLLVVSRVSIVLVAVVVFVGTARPEIGTFGVLYGFLFAAAFWAAWLPALYAGVMWRNATTAGALWSMIGGSVVALLLGLGRIFEITPEWMPPSLFALLAASAVLISVSMSTQTSEREVAVFEAMREPESTDEKEPADIGAGERSRPDRFGQVAVLVGTAAFMAVLAFTLPPLSRWFDTLIMMAALFAPVVVAGLIYTKIERGGGWSLMRRLR
ncbi:MAG: sodium:solute symporter family protein [Rubrobacteraceae bacterium]